MRVRDGVMVALVAGLVGVACDDGTGPTPTEEGVRFTFDGGSYAAAGAPSLEGGDVEGETFAIAFPDSVGGLVITSFELREGTVGDLFILQLTRRETGEFDPCGVGHDCHGRLLEGIDAADLQSVEMWWEVEAGGVTVATLTDERIAGSLDGLVLAAGDAGPTRTISGTFDLPFLSEAEGIAVMECFLERATGGDCDI